jgi:hypothetical protein
MSYLLDYLRGQGLPAGHSNRPVSGTVEVACRAEDPPQLVRDLFDALESWAPQGGGTSFLIQYGQRRTWATPRAP